MSENGQMGFINNSEVREVQNRVGVAPQREEPWCTEEGSYVQKCVMVDDDLTTR